MLYVEFGYAVLQRLFHIFQVHVLVGHVAIFSSNVFSTTAKHGKIFIVAVTIFWECNSPKCCFIFLKTVCALRNIYGQMYHFCKQFHT